MATRNDSTADRNSDSDPLTADCPGREIFHHITTRWALLILIALGEQPLRFHALRDQVDGISEKMLSQTLKVLARDGLVTRKVVHTTPPQVTYELTEIGDELAAQFRQLIGWMGRRVPDILAAQHAYDASQQAAAYGSAQAASKLTRNLQR